MLRRWESQKGSGLSVRISNDRGFSFERNCVLRRWESQKVSGLSVRISNDRGFSSKETVCRVGRKVKH